MIFYFRKKEHKSPEIDEKITNEPAEINTKASDPILKSEESMASSSVGSKRGSPKFQL